MQSARFSRAKRILGTVCGMALSLTFLGDDCGSGPLLEDGGFRLWNDDGLTAWKVEEGSIQQAPTWSAADPGVELMGPRTTMAQVLGSVPDCAVLTVVARVDGDATLTFSGGTNVAVMRAHGKFTSYSDSVGFEVILDDQGHVLKQPKLSMSRTGTGRVVVATVEAVAGRGCREDAMSRQIIVRADGGAAMPDGGTATSDR